ncbi:Uncharacterised protein [Mycobacteroides abscessus subsp. abscessus]|nr:Uncharacterised protein [Mycobacteroides abscessus subsp. abscessus]SKW35723.1 Uncharacterised protein [Mycobacteroides abscessus subsp. abscessus]
MPSSVSSNCLRLLPPSVSVMSPSSTSSCSVGYTEPGLGRQMLLLRSAISRIIS